MRFTFSFLLVISLVSCQNKNDEYVHLNLKLDSIVNHSDFNGVVLVSKDSTIIYKNTFGFSDLEQKTPLNSDDQFVIGSISKQITAALILRAVEKQNLKLTDTLNKYLTEIDQPWSKEVIIHQLLTHTHGITDLTEPTAFEVGSQFKYSQLGYELLAQVLEKVTKKSFRELSTDLFLKLGLKNTFHPDDKNYKNLVKGYVEDDNGTLQFSTNSLYNFVPAGSFISNAEDLFKWNKLLHSGKIVKMETLELMKVNYATRIHPIFETVQYGYGLLFKEDEANKEIGALGYAPGFVSASYYYPKTKMNIVVLENTAHDLNNFKNTFQVHTDIMELIKNQTWK